jgi:hypothetical protein
LRPCRRPGRRPGPWRGRCLSSRLSDAGEKCEFVAASSSVLQGVERTSRYNSRQPIARPAAPHGLGSPTSGRGLQHVRLVPLHVRRHRRAMLLMGSGAAAAADRTLDMRAYPAPRMGPIGKSLAGWRHAPCDASCGYAWADSATNRADRRSGRGDPPLSAVLRRAALAGGGTATAEAGLRSQLARTSRSSTRC